MNNKARDEIFLLFGFWLACLFGGVPLLFPHEVSIISCYIGACLLACVHSSIVSCRVSITLCDAGSACVSMHTCESMHWL